MTSLEPSRRRVGSLMSLAFCRALTLTPNFREMEYSVSWEPTMCVFLPEVLSDFELLASLLSLVSDFGFAGGASSMLLIFTFGLAAGGWSSTLGFPLNGTAWGTSF